MSGMPKHGLVLTAGTVITADAVHSPGWVEITAGVIVACGAGEPQRRPDFSFPDSTLVPGFVDVHSHGGGGSSFDDVDADAAANVIATHLSHGTTTMIASLVTAPLDVLQTTVATLADLVDTGALAGIHLEGPWLSPAHRGAHTEALLRTPDPADIDRIFSAARGAVRMVTIAPELDGGLRAIRQIVDLGAVAAIGHTDADYELARRSIAAGATAGTHLFNAMRPLHHREPGPALALLEDPTVFAEVIADGVHSHPAVVRLVTESRSRPVFVTDAMAAAGAADGAYTLGGLAVRVANGEARLASGTIAGSVLTLSAAVRYAVEIAGVSLAAAVRAATQTPADMIGLADRGRIAPGQRADLAVLASDLNVTATMLAGEWRGTAPLRAGPLLTRQA